MSPTLLSSSNACVRVCLLIQFSHETRAREYSKCRSPPPQLIGRSRRARVHQTQNAAKMAHGRGGFSVAHTNTLYNNRPKYQHTRERIQIAVCVSSSKRSKPIVLVCWRFILSLTTFRLYTITPRHSSSNNTTAASVVTYGCAVVER